jgi:hypothetical protein
MCGASFRRNVEWTLLSAAFAFVLDFASTCRVPHPNVVPLDVRVGFHRYVPRGPLSCSPAAENRQVDAQPAKHIYSCSTQTRARRMKTNITLKLDASLLREIRILAAEEGTSISALLAARLEQIVRERKSYDRSRRRALARLREGMKLGWTPPRSRDELYQR